MTPVLTEYIKRDMVAKEIERQISDQYKREDRDTQFERGYTRALKNMLTTVLYNNQLNVRAHWIVNSDGYYPYCSNCKTEPENGKMTKFCPECGAIMDEVSK